jgi:hypothetical protein
VSELHLASNSKGDVFGAQVIRTLGVRGEKSGGWLETYEWEKRVSEESVRVRASCELHLASNSEGDVFGAQVISALGG